MNLLLKYKEIIEEILSFKGVYGVYIFGSYANLKNTEKSDLDLCFLIDENDSELMHNIMACANSELDISIFHKLSHSTKMEVLKKGIIFKILDEERFREQKLKYLRRIKDEGRMFKRLVKKRYGIEV